MNILTTENLAKHNTKNRTAGVGEWKLRNGVWAMDIRPEPFYQNYTVDGTKISYCLKEEFHDGQYIFNLWIDADDVYSNSAYRASGLVIVYTDGTSYNLVATGGSGIGFQHIYYISTAGKTIARISNYYYSSIATYFRYDSYIIPLNKTSTKFFKTGQAQTNELVEDYTHTYGNPTNSMSLGQGYIETTNFIEY